MEEDQNEALKRAIEKNAYYQAVIDEKVLRTIEKRQRVIERHIDSLKQRQIADKIKDLPDFSTTSGATGKIDTQSPYFYDIHTKTEPELNADAVFFAPYVHPAELDDRNRFQWKPKSKTRLRHLIHRLIIEKKKTQIRQQSDLSAQEQSAQLEQIGILPLSKISVADSQLVNSMDEMSSIAQEIHPKCTAFDCFIMWKESENPRRCTKPWSKEEKEFLRQTVEATAENRAIDWHSIADQLTKKNQEKGLESPIRTGHQCLKQYQICINANMTSSVWTPEDDEMLTQAVRVFGTSSWQVIAELFDDRVADQCSRRWVYSLSPDIRSGQWSVIEDRRLVLAVQAYECKETGKIQWTSIQQHLPGRTGAQCRERWMYTLGPALHRTEWTSEDDRQLEQLVEVHGIGNWSKVSQEMTGRNNTQVYRRWRQLFPKEWEEYNTKRKAAPLTNIARFAKGSYKSVT